MEERTEKAEKREGRKKETRRDRGVNQTNEMLSVLILAQLHFKAEDLFGWSGFILRPRWSVGHNPGYLQGKFATPNDMSPSLEETENPIKDRLR